MRTQLWRCTIAQKRVRLRRLARQLLGTALNGQQVWSCFFIVSLQPSYLVNIHASQLHQDVTYTCGASWYLYERINKLIQLKFPLSPHISSIGCISVRIVNHALELGVGMVGGVMVIFIVIGVVCYHRRVKIQRDWKHKWCLSSDM